MTVATEPVQLPIRRVGASAELLTAVFAAAAFFALMMGVVNYSGCWFWPTDGLNDFFSVTAVGGAQFRMALWALIALMAIGVALRADRGSFVRAVVPYLGLFACALVATLRGDDPSGSFWFLAIWAIMISAGAAIGILLPPRQINLAACIIFALVSFISFALLAIHPAWAIMHFGGKFAMRGLFMHKNTAGAFAAYGSLFLLSFRTTLQPFWKYAALALSLALLVATFSATALGAFTLGALALFAIGAMQRLKGPLALKLILLLVGLGGAVAIIDGAFPLVVSALGKSQSLTGRAAGWAFYWRFFQGHLAFGRGPGAFVTGTSEINEMISRILVGDMNKSTHNAYLALLGEVGVFGLSAYVIGLLYIVFIAPLRPKANPADLAAAVIAVYVLTSGFTEAKETLSPGVGTFLILVCRGAAVAQRWSIRATQKPLRMVGGLRRQRFGGLGARGRTA